MDNRDKNSQEGLLKRIDKYKENKPNHSARSIGTTFETKNNQYFFDTGTGKVFKIDRNLQEFLYQLLFCDNDIQSLNFLSLGMIFIHGPVLDTNKKFGKEEIRKFGSSAKIYSIAATLINLANKLKNKLLGT